LAPRIGERARLPQLWHRSLRILWVVVFGALVLAYTAGLPARVARLITVLPFGGPWSSLTFAEAAVLATWNIALPTYFWIVLIAELVLAGASLTLGALIFWRQPASTGATLTALLIISLGCSESDYTRSLADMNGLLHGFHLGIQSLAVYLGLVVFYTFPDGRFVPRWTRWLALGYGLLILLWLLVPAVPFSPLPFGNFNRTPITSTLFYLGWQASGVAAMVIRYRFHSSAAQRQQTKWAAFGLLLGLGAAISFYIGRWAISGRLLAGNLGARFAYELISNLGYLLILAVIVGCFTIAILRHQLWDIDVVIRRTLRYALWSTALLGVFGISVLLAQGLIRAQALQLPLLATALLLAVGTLFWRQIWSRLRRWNQGRPAAPPDEPPTASAQLQGSALLCARLVWLSLAGTVLAMVLSGAAPRLAALRQTSPPITGGGLVLPAHLLPALQSLGLTLDGYAAWIFSVEILVVSAFFLTAAFLFWRRTTDRGAFFVALLLLSYGATETGFGSGIGRLYPLWDWPFELLQAIGAAMIIVVFCTFPDGRFALRWARPLTLGWCVLVFVWLLFPQLPFNIVNGATFNRTPFLSLGFGLIWHLAALYALVHRYRRAQGTLRLQMQWMVYALMVVSVTTTMRYTLQPALWAIPIATHPRWDVLHLMLLRPLYWLTLLVVPLSLTVAILRYRLWGIETVIRRTLLYTALSLALAGIAGLSIFVGQTLLRGLSGIDSELTAVLTTLLCVLLFEPLRRGLQARIDRQFDRTSVDFRPALIAFGRELNQLRAVPDLLDALLARSTNLLKIAHGAVYLRAADGDLQLIHARHAPPNTPAVLDSQTTTQLRPDSDWHRPGDRQWPLLLPITAMRQGERAVIGALALGPRRSEEPYQRTTIELLLALADRTGTALTVAQLVAYQTSPAGRAEALAQELARSPETTVRALHRLAQSALTSADQAAVLAALPGALQALALSSLAELATGYRLVADSRSDPTLLPAGLRLLAAHSDAGAAAPTTQLHTLYRLCRDALEIDQVAALGALLPEASALTVPDATEPPFAPPVASSIALFQRVLRTLEGLPRQATASGQLDCLRQVRAQIEQLASQLSLTIDPIERLIAQRIAQHWRDLIDAQIQAIQGRAQVEVRLITGSVVLAPQITLAAELINRGQGPARQVSLTLTPGVGYTVLADGRAVPDLAPGETQIVTFMLRPAGAAPLRPLLTLAYDDAGHGGAPRSLTFPVAVLTAPPWVAPLPNPYVAGMPLRPGSRLFIGRARDLTIIARALARPTPIALILTGQRRMGKTSLLQQLGTQLHTEVVAVYLDGQRLGLDPGLPQLFADIAERIARSLALPPSDRTGLEAGPAAWFEQRVLPVALASAGSRRLLLMIDEIEALEERSAAGRLDPAFFGYLRHLMQHEPRIGVICAGAHRLDELRPAAWSGIFNAALHHRLGGLHADDARALITGPLGATPVYDELALDQMLRLSGGQPYFLQLLCQTLVDAANERQEAVVLLEQVLAVRDQILELGEAPLADLWSDSSEGERATLIALARLLPITAVTDAAQLTALASARGMPLAQKPCDGALQRLAWRDILFAEDDETAAGGRRYRWRLALFGHWIARTQALPPYDATPYV